jgi:AsmA family protein
VGDVLGLTLPTTPAFEMRGRVRKDGALWRAAVASWRVGSSRLRGDFRYDSALTPPLLSGTLGGERLLLADLGPAIGTPADGASRAATPAPGRVLPQREFDIPSLRRMNADVLLRLDRLDLGTPRLEALAPLHGRVRLDGGVLALQELLARTSSGTLRGDISVDARSRDTPRWRTDLRWGGIELERFVKVRNPRGAQSPPAAASAATAPRAPGYVSGQLGGAARATGSGRSIAAVMASLDGSAGLWVRDGRVSHLLVELAGIDLAESLGLVIRGDRTLPLRCAVAQFTLREGRAVPETALIDTRDTTLVIDGEISLAKETLALTVKAQPHDISPVTLRTPLRIGGSFADPDVALDKSRIALRLAGAAALALVTPPAALLALIDLGEDDRRLCSQAVERVQARPADPRAKARPQTRKGAAPR